MIRVKICGLTRPEDVRAACDAGADALGFVLVRGSKREVSVTRLKALLCEAHPFVTTVGVVADHSVEEAIALADLTGLRALQFHGREAPDACRAVKQARPGLGVFKALQLRTPNDLSGLEAWEGLDGIVLDSGGGSGLPFDWAWLDAVTWPALPRIVAGGLTPQNVTQLLARFQPEAVDVSSGVEQAPGVKDGGKLRAFVRAVRRVEGFASATSGV